MLSSAQTTCSTLMVMFMVMFMVMSMVWMWQGVELQLFKLPVRMLGVCTHVAVLPQSTFDW